MDWTAVLVQDILSEIGAGHEPRGATTSTLRRGCGSHRTMTSRVAKCLRSKTGKTTSRAARAFRLAAQGVSKTDTALGAFFRRMRAIHGAAKAIVATANKIARIVYHHAQGSPGIRGPRAPLL